MAAISMIIDMRVENKKLLTMDKVNSFNGFSTPFLEKP
jgi:hypothetical protein